MCTSPNRVFEWYVDGTKYTKWTYGENVDHLELYGDGHVRIAYDKHQSPSAVKIITDYVPVSCYYCDECKMMRSVQRTDRVIMHSLTEGLENAWFVTLTYDNVHLPTEDRVNDDGVCYKVHSLVVKDVQLFHKRLRKHLFGNAKGDLTYLLVGEYGDLRKRPHYHAIYWHLPLDDVKLDTEFCQSGKPQYISETLEKIWSLGRVRLTPVSIGTIGYCCGYVQKKLYGDDRIAYYKAGIKPPFVLQSQGLGLDYMMDNWKDLLDNGSKFVSLATEQREVRPDRYFYEKIINNGLTTREAYDILKNKRGDFAKSKELMVLHKTDKTKKEYFNEVAKVKSKKLRYCIRDIKED